VEACFKDHYAFKSIDLDDTLLRTLMTSDALKKDIKDERTLYIPYLVLFGVLFCASDKALKVSKFYELC